MKKVKLLKVDEFLRCEGYTVGEVYELVDRETLIADFTSDEVGLDECAVYKHGSIDYWFFMKDDVEIVEGFGLSDIKTRMVVELENGKRGLIVDGSVMYLDTNGGYDLLETWHENLKCKHGFEGHEIVRVWGTVSSLESARTVHDNTLIFGEKEFPEPEDSLYVASSYIPASVIVTVDGEEHVFKRGW